MKIAKGLPPEKKLTKEDFARLEEEARRLRAAVDAHASKIERLDASDWHVRVR